MTQFRFSVILLLQLISTIALSQKKLGFIMEEGKDKVTIPFEMHSNLIVVPVIVNNALPLKFIVDTGVQSGILTDKAFTDVLNLTYTKKYTLSGPGTVKEFNAYITNNVTLQLPGVRGEGHTLLVLEEDYLELRNYLGTEVQGILGYELFSRFVVEFNYTQKVMTVYRHECFKKRRKHKAVPITIEDTKPFLLAEVAMQDGHKVPVKLLVDTGASHGIMLDPASHEFLVPPPNTVSSTIGRGLGGEIRGKVGRIDYLQIDEFKLDNPIVSFPDDDSYIDSIRLGNSFRHGTIGEELLSRFTVTFNFPDEKIYLKKNSSFKKRFYYNLSGITVKAEGNKLNIFEIVDVREGSTAYEAGVKKGDIIKSINFNHGQDLSLASITNLLNSKPGKKIRLVVSRKGITQDLKFQLRDPI